MNINRHNYEEYFLLYTDNELQPEERMQVETFAAQNPDLADELMLLQQAILPGDELVRFGNKADLFRKEAGITTANCEGYFLSYIDNELTAEEAAAVETFVLQHPQLQAAFTLLKQTKLQAELIIFKDKQTLYRSEKERRLIPILWMRMGAAAAVIGLIALLWTFTQNQQSSNGNNTIAETSQTINQPGKNSTAIVTKQGTPSLQKGAVAKNDENNTAAPSAVKTGVVDKAFKSKETKDQQQSIAQQKQEPEEKANDKKDELPQIVVQQSERIAPKEDKEIVAQVAISNKKEEGDKTQEIMQQARHQTIEGQPALASNAVYREINTDEEDRNIYIGSAAINKSKLKSIFKKAAGLFGKNKSSDDDTNR